MKQSDCQIQNKSSAPLTIAEWVNQARTAFKAIPEEPLSSLYAVIAYALEKPGYWAQAHPEFLVNTAQSKRLDSCLKRLLAGEPLPYITGKQAFYGLEFSVNPNVLIPRPETELLVETALKWLSDHPSASLCADVGTGSGCIAIAIIKQNHQVHFVATDRSHKSLEIAKQNIHNHQLEKRIDLLQTDLLAGASATFDLVCANLPYIPTPKLAGLRVSQHEPLAALDGGPDGLILIDKLLQQAQSCVKTGGLILLEMEYSQSDAIRNLIHFHFPSASITITNDLKKQPRLVKITL